MIVKTLQQSDLSSLEHFCKQCEKLNYNNNSSLKAMKYDWCKNWGDYWGAWYKDKLLAVAGAHPLPEIDENAVRVLFRGCQLYSPYQSLNANHMNSVPFRDILPLQIKKYAQNDLYITTNIKHDASGKMSRTHRVMKLLAKKGIVSLHTENIELYYTQQTVWKLNKENYINARNKILGS